jgi:glycosyltransferase involved in cell wall biosynthesis
VPCLLAEQRAIVRLHRSYASLRRRRPRLRLLLMRLSTQMRVGIMWGMDAASVVQGQYRYAVDLFQSLAKLDERVEFVVFGTRPSPPSEISQLFQSPRSAWAWRRMLRWPSRGSDHVDPVLGALQAVGARVDVLHVIEAPVPVAGLFPVVATVHDILAEVLPEERVWRESKGWRRHRRNHQTKVTRILASSQATARDIAERWQVDPSRIDLVYLAARFPPPGYEESEVPQHLRRFSALAGRPFLSAAFNLYPRKNIEALLAATSILRPRFPQLRLALFGKTGASAEREAWFERALSASGLGDVAVRLGPVDDLELAALYHGAEMFVFPSLFEGFGLPLLEAMSVSACVVARNASSMAEVVGDGGRLVETRDPAALAAAIAELLDHPEERARLRQSARARASVFSAEKMARQTLESYQRAVNGFRRADAVAARF